MVPGWLQDHIFSCSIFLETRYGQEQDKTNVYFTYLEKKKKNRANDLLFNISLHAYYLIEQSADIF